MYILDERACCASLLWRNHGAAPATTTSADSGVVPIGKASGLDFSRAGDFEGDWPGGIVELGEDTAQAASLDVTLTVYWHLK